METIYLKKIIDLLFLLSDIWYMKVLYQEYYHQSTISSYNINYKNSWKILLVSYHPIINQLIQ